MLTAQVPVALLALPKAIKGVLPNVFQMRVTDTNRVIGAPVPKLFWIRYASVYSCTPHKAPTELCARST